MTVALDLFAGHGWGVACRALGIEEYGVEIMPEAVAVRELNGMHTMYNDVWDGLLIEEVSAWWDIEPYDLLIASPPCQTFSMAGGGAGRKALDEVLAAIDARLYLDPAKLVAFGETHDPKTALVLAPLAHIARDLPMHVVLEQVPPVLPVWERYAEEMRRWGYSVWTGNLQAEQYGVPQTRKRAILIARADGREAKAPTPTHSRYYSRDPQRLDPGVKPWVSMAEALGWGMTERPFVTAGNAVGRAEGIGGSGGKAAVQREQERGAWIGNQVPGGREKGDYQTRDADDPAPTITAGSRSAKVLRSPQSVAGVGRVERDEDEPSVTVTTNFDRAQVVMRSNYSSGGPKGATAAERGRTMRAEDQPSVAMTGKPGHWVPAEGSRPAPTVTGGGAATGGAEVFGRHGREIVEKIADAAWQEERPATTVAGDSRVWPPGHKVNGDDERRLGDEARERYGDRAGTKATRVSIEEAAALQSYPADFRWDADVADPRTGRMKPITKTNTFLQIGNAVPPRLAEAILREVLSDA